MQVNVAGLRRNIKNLAHNYSDAQVKVREATSNDPWGPSATIMAEIADLTYNVVAFSEIMQMIWKRLNDHGKNWRHVYKALILLEYLIKTGTEKVAQQCKENIFAIQTLREFVYFEEGKDQGTHVREKAKQLVNLLKDDERLKNERIKALKAKERFAQHPSGFGSDGYIDGPSHRDMPPGWQEEPKPVSELEMVRPQTAGEEELQLQLAMAMSREEAEQEEAKRRSDDVRLQLALSQSEQDFKEQTQIQVVKEEPQSHLLDLLDISLGATSISSPPLGATGGAVVDPWGTPASRAGSQLSDPWSGTSSPQIDPWQPAAMARNAHVAAPVAAATNGSDAWALRTKSPSVASGSSTEGWLQTNGNANHAASTVMQPATDPWLTKTTATAVTMAAVPPLAASNSTDPWLADTAPKATNLEDPWSSKGNSIAAANIEDPWKAIETDGKKKHSPDLDEFDIITNRKKTGDDDINKSFNIINNNKNATSLLDEMDPLSTNYGNISSNTSLAIGSSTGAITKKPFKDPQAFLGENSSLVNLDNLIKPIAPQTQIGGAAYNPFSDTVTPSKTNLFQQQQPAVPSINQLKQQAPFAVNLNQDPWAPANTATNVTAQHKNSEDNFANYHKNVNQAKQQINIERPISLDLSNSVGFNFSNNKTSLSNFELYNCNKQKSQLFCDNNNPNNVDNIRNMDIATEIPFSQHFNGVIPNTLCTTPIDSFQFNTNQSNNNVSTTTNAPHAQKYSSALSASLATTPGITIAPLGTTDWDSFGISNMPMSREATTTLQNNNNLPWSKPETAATNPFLS